MLRVMAVGIALDANGRTFADPAFVTSVLVNRVSGAFSSISILA